MFQVKEGCPGCGACLNICPVNAIVPGNDLAVIITEDCIDCGICSGICPVGLIKKVADNPTTSQQEESQFERGEIDA